MNECVSCSIYARRVSSKSHIILQMAEKGCLEQFETSLRGEYHAPTTNFGFEVTYKNISSRCICVSVVYISFVIHEHFFLFCKIANKSTITINLLITTLLHVSTLSCYFQGARIHYRAKLHKYINCNCWYVGQDSCLMFVKVDIRKKFCYARGCLRCTRTMN